MNIKMEAWALWGLLYWLEVPSGINIICITATIFETQLNNIYQHFHEISCTITWTEKVTSSSRAYEQMCFCVFVFAVWSLSVRASKSQNLGDDCLRKERKKERKKDTYIYILTHIYIILSFFSVTYFAIISNGGPVADAREGWAG